MTQYLFADNKEPLSRQDKWSHVFANLKKYESDILAELTQDYFDNNKKFRNPISLKTDDDIVSDGTHRTCVMFKLLTDGVISENEAFLSVEYCSDDNEEIETKYLCDDMFAIETGSNYSLICFSYQATMSNALTYKEAYDAFENMFESGDGDVGLLDMIWSFKVNDFAWASMNLLLPDGPLSGVIVFELDTIDENMLAGVHVNMFSKLHEFSAVLEEEYDDLECLMFKAESMKKFYEE